MPISSNDSVKDVDLGYHRKYRPNSLARYIGNEKLKKTAMSALTKAVRPQVILLKGASGCGKTTFARLLAKEYSCENRDPVKGACGECQSCRDIDEYIQTGDTSMLEHIKEIDIADNSGKKDLDGVIEEMTIPAFGAWKVYIFDECHMSSPQQQNRLLKIVEEPPEQVLLIFSTTNPEDMLTTLVNRCQLHLQVVKPTVTELGGLLKYVCSVEQVDYDVKGLNFIANRSELTIRSALTGLEQVINEEGCAKYDNAIRVFEEISDKIIIDFYRKLMGTNGSGRDITGYVTLLHKIKSTSDLSFFVESLIQFTMRGIFIINNVKLDGVSDGELKVYRDIFSQFTIEQITALLTKLLSLNGKDIESKLLLLGYTGLLTMNGNVNNPNAGNSLNVGLEGLELLDESGKTSIDGISRSNSTIKASPSELLAEKRQAMRNKEITKEQNLAKGIENANAMTEASTADIIQTMFGGADIVK